MFHGFASLQRSVLAALEDERENEAVYLVFGQRADSLRRLVEGVAERRDEETLVDDYLILLCAEQLVRGLRRDWPEFWAKDPGAKMLERALADRAQVRSALIARNDSDMEEFLAWHERQFLRSAKEPQHD
jgi:hypothetical protein